MRFRQKRRASNPISQLHTRQTFECETAIYVNHTITIKGPRKALAEEEP
jgi:hypothetical protein